MAMSGFICSCMQPRPNQVNASTFIFDLSATIDMAIKTNSSVHKKNEMQFYFNIGRTAPTNTHTHTRIYILYCMDMNWIANKQMMKYWRWWTKKKIRNHFRIFFVWFQKSLSFQHQCHIMLVQWNILQNFKQ